MQTGVAAKPALFQKPADVPQPAAAPVHLSKPQAHRDARARDKPHSATCIASTGNHTPDGAHRQVDVQPLFGIRSATQALRMLRAEHAEPK
ncbi:hypothetical protein ACFQS6_01185 [Xanthomonas populi]|uniref:Uncharacterized protein n=1 Tax=Xanthomonas populi TaxID=53414 RepID=A0A2S7ES23_9XANT|nr:hypothetical protein [Xanthomonas populi]PPU95919.1 hypothetical protein XpopCFBP1817_07580 [Xanthomonas populi]